jgi:ABC-type protease/lipase transport system fused ATPase/permease subunit
MRMASSNILKINFIVYEFLLGWVRSRVAILYQCKTSTKIFVAHDASVLEFCNKVMIIENKALAFFGNVESAAAQGRLKRYVK